MKYKPLTFLLVYLLVTIVLVGNSSFNELEPTLKFKVMVINKKYLMDSLFNNGIPEVVFQHRNGKGNDANRRRKFHLIAYAEKADRSFSPIDEKLLFEKRTKDPLWIDMTIKNDGVTGNFGNLNFKKADFTDDPDYKYILLVPEVYNLDDDSKPMDREYIHYKMYFTNDINDYPSSQNMVAKLVVPIPISLNPSPPRNP